MILFWTVVLFVFGSIIGSFLNVCIYRLPRDKSPWRPSRSFCPTCHEMIQWYDNIPLISWVILNGQCRRCRAIISSRYVLVELLTAVLFVVEWHVLRSRPETLGVISVYLALIAFLIVCTFTDIELRIVPNSVVIGGILIAPALSLMVPELHNSLSFGRTFVWSHGQVAGPLLACLVGMAAGACLTWGAGVAGKLLFRREAMGLGDVKFMAVIGGLLGWKLVMMAFFLAPLFGAVYGLMHLMRTKEHHIPYIPFLSAATLIVMLFGDKMLMVLWGLGMP